MDHTGLSKKEIIEGLRRLDVVDTDRQDQDDYSHVGSDADDASDVDD